MFSEDMAQNVGHAKPSEEDGCKYLCLLIFKYMKATHSSNL